MNFVQMTHRGRLGHESLYALLERALNERALKQNGSKAGSDIFKSGHSSWMPGPR